MYVAFLKGDLINLFYCESDIQECGITGDLTGHI